MAQLSRSTAQSVTEFEWRQAEQGRTLINAMMTDDGWAAMTMLDFPEGRIYEVAPGTKVLIRPSDVVAALANPVAEGSARTETQRFIIDR